MRVGLATVCTLLLLMGCTDSDDRQPSALSSEDLKHLQAALSCDSSAIEPLWRVKNGHSPTNWPEPSVYEHPMCRLSLDALCTTHPEAPVCEDRPIRGAYAGYYLMRYAMPIVAMARTESAQERSTDLGTTVRPALLSLFGLLQPSVAPCPTAGGLRTWCTTSDDGKSFLAPTHQTATAYLLSELLRFAVQGDGLSGDQIIDARRSFDLLLWDHALLLGTHHRNSQTARWRHQPTVARFAAQHQTTSEQTNSAPIQFQVDGWLVATAANLLAVEKIADPQFRLRLSPRHRNALEALVTSGVALFDERLEETMLTDWHGNEVSGAMFDRFRWDQHEYRRFSGITESTRPIDVHFDDASGAFVATPLKGESARARGVGHDSGHYRRLTWLYYTLTQTQRVLEQKWVPDTHTEHLANQFAYAVYIDGDVPRFTNYVSGHDGWYRVTTTEVCEPGVPPSGFSTLMLISENLWWSQFNRDILAIWEALDASVDNANTPPPSEGVMEPCGDGEQRKWRETYRQIAMEDDGSPSLIGLDFLAMRRWAETSLD